MPTDRFYRLPAEKSEAIRAAAIREFMRVRPEEASINRIIRDAEISRGSFYTYFQDKYDLLKWIIGDRIREYQESYLVRLQELNGNIWELLEWEFPFGVKKTLNDGFMELLEKVVESSLFTDFLKGEGEQEDTASEWVLSFLEQMYELVDQEKCPMSWQMFYDLMETQGMIYVRALKSLLHDKMPLEQVSEYYRRLLKMLRYGADQKNGWHKNRESQEETKQI